MPTTDYTPALEDVGVVTLSRTKDQYGNVVGTFDDTTTPTGDQVDELIAKATSRVSMKIGTDIPPVTWDDAKTLVAIRTAMFIEVTFFPEQISDNRSPYNILKEQYASELCDIQLAITAAEATESGNDLGSQPFTKASWSFPPPPCDNAFRDGPY